MTRYPSCRLCQGLIFLFLCFILVFLSRAHTVKHVQPSSTHLDSYLSPTGQDISNEWRPTNQLCVTHHLLHPSNPSTTSPCFLFRKPDVFVCVAFLSFLSLFPFSCPCHLHFVRTSRLFPTRRPGSRQTSASGMSVCTTCCTK